MIAILMAAAISIAASLFFTRVLIGYFTRLGKGQPILGAEDRGPTHHMHKQGTPTMGGIAILSAAFAIPTMSPRLPSSIPIDIPLG